MAPGGAPSTRPGDLLDRPTVDEPYPLYRHLVAESPVWRVPGRDIVVVTSHRAVVEATRRITDFSSNIRNLLFRDEDGLPTALPFDVGEVGQALATADPPTHTRHRNALAPVFTARRMASLRDEIEAIAAPRIETACATSAVDFMADIANAIPIRVIARLIGFEREDPDQLLAAAFDSTAMLAVAEPTEVILDAMARSTVVIEWLQDQLRQAVEHGAEGILGALAQSINAGGLGFDESLVILATLLSAGGESTTSLIGSAAHYLATMPELQRRLRTDPTLIAPFVEEVLRLESPFRHHLRHAPHDTTLEGVEIPAGATVLLMWGAANRDPAEYDRPADVLLERTSPRHHLAFGRGIHLCLGASLARIEAEVVLTQLLAQSEHVALDPAASPERVNSIMVRRFERLPLCIWRATGGRNR